MRNARRGESARRDKDRERGRYLVQQDIPGHATTNPAEHSHKRIPMTVQCRQWSGRRTSSAPLKAFVVAAIRSIVVKLPGKSQS
jgi:hypothetical protein